MRTENLPASINDEESDDSFLARVRDILETEVSDAEKVERIRKLLISNPPNPFEQ